MTEGNQNTLPGRRAGTTRKLSDEQVREIRQLANVPCAECGVKPSLRVLGERFGVSAPAILDIVERRSWRHVEESSASYPDRAVTRLDAAADLLRKRNVPIPSAQMLQYAADVIDAVRAHDRES